MSGLGREAISKQIHISTHTIQNWVTKFNWEAERQKLNNSTAMKVYGDLEKERERTLQLIHGAESLAAKKIQDGTLKADLSSLASIIKVKWDLINPNAKTSINLEGETFNVNITCSGGINARNKLRPES
jgi:transposase